MGVHEYGVCHTCRQRMCIGKGYAFMDPKLGPAVDEDEIRELNQRAKESGLDLGRFLAFVYAHPRHCIEVVTDEGLSDERIYSYKSVFESPFDDPFAHRRRTPEPP